MEFFSESRLPLIGMSSADLSDSTVQRPHEPSSDIDLTPMYFREATPVGSRSRDVGRGPFPANLSRL